MAVTGDGSLVDARLGSAAMDTNIRLAILVLIFLFGGLVWAGTLLLRRRRAQVEATSFREHAARLRVANRHQVAPVLLRRQK